MIKSLVANFIGRAWSAILTILFLPTYVHYLGIEAYGLVGFYVTLTTLMAPFDFGLGPTMKREMSIMSAKNLSGNEFANFTRTLEFLFWSVGICIGLGFVLLAPFIANYWIQSKMLYSNEIQTAVRLMGIAFACQWPISLYSLGILGLQKQVIGNLAFISFGSVNAFGLLFVLKYVSPTISAYFLWSIIVSFTQSIILSIVLWKQFPKFSGKPKFSIEILKRIKTFALGMTATTISSIILTNIDRLLFSKLLSLESFGKFILATTLVRCFPVITAPIFHSFCPLLTQSAVLGHTEALKNTYHQGCKILSLLIIPLGVIMMVFSPEIFYIWIGKDVVTSEFYITTSIYSFGSLLNSLFTMPFALLLSFGKTKLLLMQNIIGILILTPLQFILIFKFGVIGASVVWALLNIGYIAISIPIMHKTILPFEQKVWYLQDVIFPLICSLIIVTAFRLLFPKTDNLFSTWVLLIGSYLASFFSIILVTPSLRRRVAYE